jgi:hypothetical protein
MDEQGTNQMSDAKKVISELFESRAKKAYFISEVRALLQGARIGADEIELALRDLETEGAVIIRDHFCADPHLDGIDLRIVAVVDKTESTNPELSAIHEIDKAWDQWLGSYLANHRCS